MQLGMIGLGRMGGNIVRRLLQAGHTAVVYDRNAETVAGLATEGATPSDGLESFVAALTVPRTAWVMLPAGKPTEDTVMRLAELMSPGDIIIATPTTRTTSAGPRRWRRSASIMSTSAPAAASGASSAAIA
jgi:6-phosphogluconate dehydrogenase